LELPQERGDELLLGSLDAKNEWHEDGSRKTSQRVLLVLRDAKERASVTMLFHEISSTFWRLVLPLTILIADRATP
jgi:hypothetical protein